VHFFISFNLPGFSRQDGFANPPSHHASGGNDQQRYQQHDDAGVRHAAIQAIRLMPQPEVEETLRAVLDRKDRSDVVAALHSLGRRPKASRESVDRVETLARHDPSAEVRREAALVLGLWNQTWPELAAVLADLREHDPDARVREVAKPLGSQ